MSYILKARTALNMSQSQLAGVLGVSQPTVSRLEKSDGEVPPLFRLALERVMAKRKVKVQDDPRAEAHSKEGAE